MTIDEILIITIIMLNFLFLTIIVGSLLLFFAWKQREEGRGTFHDKEDFNPSKDNPN